MDLLDLRIFSILIAFLSLAGSQQGYAQASAPANPEGGAGTYAITGTVLDPSEAAIVNARVTLLVNGETVIAESTTDRSGTFRLDHVVPGTYTVDFHAEGFGNIRMAAVVTAKRFGPMRVVLPILVQAENVTVATGDSIPTISTEASANQNMNQVTRDALDRLPVFDQDYITTMSRFLDDNAIGTNGVTLVVNGIEANGPGVTPSAVQEVRINNNPYSARFSRPGRARLEIITKSGSQPYHGSANFMFRDSLFDASNRLCH